MLTSQKIGILVFNRYLETYDSGPSTPTASIIFSSRIYNEWLLLVPFPSTFLTHMGHSAFWLPKDYPFWTLPAPVITCLVMKMLLAIGGLSFPVMIQFPRLL